MKEIIEEIITVVGLLLGEGPRIAPDHAMILNKIAKWEIGAQMLFPLQVALLLLKCPRMKAKQDLHLDNPKCKSLVKNRLESGMQKPSHGSIPRGSDTSFLPGS